MSSSSKAQSLARGLSQRLGEDDGGIFIGDPAWLLEGGGGYPGRRGRIYKTGGPGLLWQERKLPIFAGRKDDQVKIRGQRIELGEIEHHLRECIPEAEQIAVEIIMPEGANAVLAAFLKLDREKRSISQAGKAANDSSAVQIEFLPEKWTGRWPTICPAIWYPMYTSH